MPKGKKTYSNDCPKKEWKPNGIGKTKPPVC